MIHPATELRFVHPSIGYGVFATQAIPRGTITWAQCALDRVFTSDEILALEPEYLPHIEKYAYLNARGEHVLCWDHGRFMNHSCAPAVLSPGFDIDIAIRDIRAGEELTCDYALLNIEGPMACHCGAGVCRHMLEDEDRRRLLPKWDAQIRAAFQHVLRVAQPLWSYVRDPHAVAAAARGEQPVPSCAVHLRAV
jgi:hypothetical protein